VLLPIRFDVDGLHLHREKASLALLHHQPFSSVGKRNHEVAPMHGHTQEIHLPLPH
jgi:hypothetical protein